jgi:HEAT repeat protein
MMIYKGLSMKYFRRKVAITLISVCCLLLIAPFQSFKNNESSATTIESLDTSPDPCAVAKELAQKREKKAVEPLIKLIKRRGDKQVIKCAAEALAIIDTSKSVNILVNLLSDSDLLIASRSAFALGIIKDKRATNYLLKALFESNIPCAAAMALGMIKDPSAMAPLIKAMHHENSDIRGCAIQALAFYGDPQVCETLTDIFMTDSDQGVQFMARAAKEAIQCPSGDKQPTSSIG